MRVLTGLLAVLAALIVLYTVYDLMTGGAPDAEQTEQTESVERAPVQETSLAEMYGLSQQEVKQQQRLESIQAKAEQQLQAVVPGDAPPLVHGMRLKPEFGVNAEQKPQFIGMRITEMTPESPVQALGLKVGDRLTRMGAESFNSAVQAMEVLRAAQGQVELCAVQSGAELCQPVLLEAVDN